MVLHFTICSTDVHNWVLLSLDASVLLVHVYLILHQFPAQLCSVDFIFSSASHASYPPLAFYLPHFLSLILFFFLSLSHSLSLIHGKRVIYHESRIEKTVKAE